MTWIKLLSLALNLAILFLQQAQRARAIGEVEARIAEMSIHEARKIAQARDAALRDFDARNGVPDDNDPNLRD